MRVVHASSGVATGVDEAEEHFAMLAVFSAVIPRLYGVEFGVCPVPARAGNWRGSRLFVRRVVIQDSLAGIALHYLAGAYFIEGLRAQHDLAAHTFLVASLGDPAAPVSGNAVIML